MKKFILFIFCLCLGGSVLAHELSNNTFRIFSTTFKNNDILPDEQVCNGYGFDCKGGNKAPELYWVNAP